MAYVRKTRDVWEIQGNYGYGWERENVETTRKDGLRSLREYRANGPGDYRMVMKRERIDDDIDYMRELFGVAYL